MARPMIRTALSLAAALALLTGAPAVAQVPPVQPPVATVPLSIADNCSTSVEQQIMNWIAGVPDGSVLQFGANKCYGINRTIVLQDRVGLTIDGNGSTFRALTTGDGNRDVWRIEGGANITLRNMTVRGANANGGLNDNAYVPSLEWQHGFRFAGTQTALLDNVRVSHVYGDFVEAMWDWRLPDPYSAPMSTNITVQNSQFERNGRMGFGLTGVDGFTLLNSYVGEVNMAAVDLELDFDTALGRNIRILNNTFGPHRFALFANGGAGSAPNVGNILISGNRETAAPVTCEPTIFTSSPDGTYRTGWTVTDNEFITLSDTLLLDGAEGVSVAGNTVDYQAWGGCGRFAGVGLEDSRGVVVVGNQFTGADQPVRSDSSSVAVVEAANLT